MWHPNSKYFNLYFSKIIKTVFPDGKVCISVLHPNDDKDFEPEERASERFDF